VLIISISILVTAKVLIDREPKNLCLVQWTSKSDFIRNQPNTILKFFYKNRDNAKDRSDSEHSVEERFRRVLQQLSDPRQQQPPQRPQRQPQQHLVSIS
jgi:hypothetical protein